MTTYRFLYITTKDQEQAEQIGQALLADKLVACVNILPQMKSLYWWQGEITSDNEAVLIAKTKQNHVDQVIAKVKALHSYEVPCVVSLPIENGNPTYLQWIDSVIQS